MKRNSIRIAVAIVASLAATLFLSTAVFAFLSQPDSNPSCQNLHVNRSLLTPGDMLVHGTAYFPYATEPTTMASEVFSISLLQLDGTLIAINVPYDYFNNGYNHIAFSLYVTDNSTWGTECIVRISENPALFSSPTYFDTTLATGDYSEETTQAANQAELAQSIIDIARFLQPFYQSDTLLQSTSGGFVLASPAGETYFTGVIPLLQYMAPSLFLLQSYSADVTSSNWTTAQFDIYSQRWDGSWIGIATNATANQFNVTPMMITSLVIILPLCVGAVVVSSRKHQRAEPGYVVCSIILILGAVMGWIPAALFASINQIEGFYIGYLLFYSRG